MAESDKSAVEIVREFYQLMGEDKFGEAAAYLSSDVVIKETTDLPFGGEYHGHDGNAELVGKMTSAFDLDITESEFFGSGNLVAAKLRARFSPKKGGSPLDLDIVEVITVRDGQIAELDIYHKTPSAVAAAWSA